MSADISYHEIHSLLKYDNDTGMIIWRERLPDMFMSLKHSREHACAIWNSRLAGKPAGHIGVDGYLRVEI